MAVASYHDANGKFPPAYIVGPDGRPWHSWRILILPYIEEGDLHKAYNFSEPWDGPNNRKLAERMPRLYAFHGMHKPGNTTTNYLAVVGEGTVWPVKTSVSFADVTDSHAETILVVENQGENVHWMEPRDLSLATMDFQFNSPKGISSQYKDPAVAMIDGSLHKLGPAIQVEALRALLTIRGGERLQSKGPGNWELLADGRQRTLKEP